MEFKNIFKNLRIKKNISQEELAKQIGVTRSSVANWEQGQNFPNNEVLVQIANFFNCSIDYLMGKSYFQNPQARQNEIKHTIAALEFMDNEVKVKIDKVLQKLISMNINSTIPISDLDAQINYLLQDNNLDFPANLLESSTRITKTIFLDFLERPILFTTVEMFILDYSINTKNISNESESKEEYTPEIRAIARDVAKLKPEKKELFKNLLKQMSDEADEASKK